MTHDKIAPLNVKEMSALASRFEARAASVLLRDQPQLQSDMRLAARLINEWIGRVVRASAEPPTGAVDAEVVREAIGHGTVMTRMLL